MNKILAIVISILSLFPGLVFAYPQSANVQAYWSFEGNSNDCVNSNNGTDTGIVYSSASGLIGQYATFDGATSKILISDSSNFAFGTGPFSVSFWIKTTQGGNHQIWAGRSSGSGPQIIMQGGKLYSDGVGTGGLTSTASINTGSWVFVTIVWDRSGSLERYYINGTADQTTALGATTATEAVTKAIGFQQYSEGDTDNFINAKIDEMDWWNVALSASDVTTLYNSGSGLQDCSSAVAATSNFGILSFFGWF